MIRGAGFLPVVSNDYDEFVSPRYFQILLVYPVFVKDDV